LKKGVHLGNPEANLPKGIPGSAAEGKSGDEDEGKDRKRDQGELAIELEEDDDDPHEEDDVLER